VISQNVQVKLKLPGTLRNHNARTVQKELEKLTPWNEEVQRMFARKME
jgi:hypothetical protein